MLACKYVHFLFCLYKDMNLYKLILQIGNRITLVWLHCRFLVPGNTQKTLTEIWHHFWLKMMVKSGLEKIILKFHVPLQRYLLTSQANSAYLGRFFCTGQQQLWRGTWNFKIFFSRPLFTIIFKPKMVISRLKILVCLFWLF